MTCGQGHQFDVSHSCANSTVAGYSDEMGGTHFGVAESPPPSPRLELDIDRVNLSCPASGLDDEVLSEASDNLEEIVWSNDSDSEESPAKA